LSKQVQRILVTGAVGQVGSDLTLALRERYGADHVIAAGHRTEPSKALQDSGPFVRLDIQQRDEIEAVVSEHRIRTIFHMAAILSAVGEEKPQLAWSVNVKGLINVLEIARERNMTRIFVPSSIAVFGPETPREAAPQETVLRPTTMYGISKLSGELLGEYYARRYGLDARGLRYPGIISSETLPGGGTTDYAVEIFYAAIRDRRYTCFVREDTILPMMYIPDCIKATIDLMEADAARLVHHCDFNLAALSFSAGELAAEIRKHIPDFVCEFRPDSRQEIADSWPCTVDDSAAREEWGWTPSYDLPAMVTDMLARLTPRLTSS